MKRWQVASVAVAILAIVIIGGFLYYYQTASVEKRVFVYQFFETQPSWDPSVAFDSTTVSLLNLYETLLRINKPGSTEMFTPILATSWDTSSDGLIWTFHLRHGVKFHSGNLMTATDVKFSMERTIRMGVGAAWIWSSVEQINALDDYTVQFKLKYPAGLDFIAASVYGAYIMDSKLLQSIGDDNATMTWFMEGKDAGTGPYILENYLKGAEVDFVKFADYWGGWKDNQIERAVLKIVEEPTTVVQMIQGGEVQLITSPPIDSVSSLKSNPNLTVVEFPCYANTWIDLNVLKDPTNDTLVRKALAYSFPYEDVVDKIFLGHVTQARGVVPAGIWGHKDDLFQYTYDPAKAKGLLAQAGWKDVDGDGILEKDGRKLAITVANSAGSEEGRRVVELWATDLRDLGFDVKIEITPWDTHWARGKSFDTAAQAWFLGWWPTYITPYDSLYEFYTEKTPFFNMAYYSNPEFDKLLDTASSLEGVDKARAIELYGQAQQILIDDCPAIFAWDSNRVYVVSKDVGGFDPSPAYDPGVFLYQLYWVR
jgi:peptide/nickel transport system substrate-binding protein